MGVAKLNDKIQTDSLHFKGYAILEDTSLEVKKLFLNDLFKANKII